MTTMSLTAFVAGDEAGLHRGAEGNDLVRIQPPLRRLAETSDEPLDDGGHPRRAADQDHFVRCPRPSVPRRPARGGWATRCGSRICFVQASNCSRRTTVSRRRVAELALAIRHAHARLVLRREPAFGRFALLDQPRHHERVLHFGPLEDPSVQFENARGQGCA